jgi:hypothetical protein
MNPPKQFRCSTCGKLHEYTDAELSRSARFVRLYRSGETVVRRVGTTDLARRTGPYTECSDCQYATAEVVLKSSTMAN